MDNASKSSTYKTDLKDSVKYLKGVGPQRAALLAKLGIHRVQDLLFHFPRDYEALGDIRSIAQLEDRQAATICGVVEEVDLRELGEGRSLLGVLLREEGWYLRAVWFNQQFLKARFRVGQRLLVSGIARMRGGRWEMSHPLASEWPVGDELPASGLLPVYPLTEGIRQPAMRRIISYAAEQYSNSLEDVLPEDFRTAHRLLPIGAALRQLHNPANAGELDEARRRLIYQELLVLQLALAMSRRRLTLDQAAPPLPLTAKIRARILRLFPFELTAAQLKAIDEIAADMAQPHPMNRLLQGDVGSGKTVVAVFAMLLAVAHNRQAALMAPTEVLARQHVRQLERSLSHSELRIALLSGSLTRSERQATLEDIEAGKIDLVVGTHAIAHAVEREGVRFARLGLVVIDEQHKFGVRQRAQLKQAGVDPHYLVMTATPIPRTVGMTLFGDLDISSLREAPPGRQRVHTYLSDSAQRDKWWDFFRRKLQEGRQGYVVLPLVDDQEAEEISGAEQAFEAQTNDYLEQFRVDLLHGRMDSQMKDHVMERFARGETQVLVTTSVVEVGIDVPNATIMTIEGGERFGLAQLHQLRGRISRGEYPGYLCVFAQPQTKEARERLEAFEKCHDGFELAEIDFRYRGPGDLFGVKQHGLPPLMIADLERDAKVLEEARRAAQLLIAADPALAAPEFAALRRMVMRRYGQALSLGDVG